MGLVTRNGLTIPIGMHYGKEIIIASDHRGHDAKLRLMYHINNNQGLLDCIAETKSNFVVTDIGSYTKERCDHVDYAENAASIVSSDWLDTVGIAICGSGIGMSIASGKIPRVYPARCLTLEDAVNSRKHNNSNFLCLSASTPNNNDIITVWLLSKFYSSEDDDPYLDRFIKLLNLETKYLK